MSARRRVLVRALKVAAIVGTVITLITHGDEFYRRDPITLRLVLKMLLSYATPFTVSLVSGLLAARDAERQAK